MDRIAWAKVALCGLTLGGALSAYQTAFSFWMTAHPLYHSPEWSARFYTRLTTTAVVGVLWIMLVMWLWKQRRTTRPRI